MLERAVTQICALASNCIKLKSKEKKSANKIILVPLDIIINFPYFEHTYSVIICHRLYFIVASFVNKILYIECFFVSSQRHRHK